MEMYMVWGYGRYIGCFNLYIFVYMAKEEIFVGKNWVLNGR